MASRGSILLFCVAVSLTLSISSAQTACPTLFVNLNNRCYLFSQDESLSFDWDGAQAHCNLYTVDTNIYDLVILDDDIAEPPAVGGYMISKGYTSALIGARDLELSVSTWAWVDNTALDFKSSIWDCDYPKALTTDYVGYYVNTVESIDGGQTASRFRLRDTPPTTVDYFICEGAPLAIELIQENNL